jgi:hypothetical protein
MTSVSQLRLIRRLTNRMTDAEYPTREEPSNHYPLPLTLRFVHMLRDHVAEADAVFLL